MTDEKSNEINEPEKNNNVEEEQQPENKVETQAEKDRLIMKKNWQYIYDNAKEVIKDLSTKKIDNIKDLEKKHGEFKERYPKVWNSIIQGTFSLDSYKKYGDIYFKVYDDKEGDHFDKKNLANIAFSNRAAYDYGVYKDKEPSSKEMQKAYEQTMAKNELVKSNTKKK